MVKSGQAQNVLHLNLATSTCYQINENASGPLFSFALVNHFIFAFNFANSSSSTFSLALKPLHTASDCFTYMTVLHSDVMVGP